MGDRWVGRRWKVGDKEGVVEQTNEENDALCKVKCHTNIIHARWTHTHSRTFDLLEEGVEGEVWVLDVHLGSIALVCCHSRVQEHLSGEQGGERERQGEKERKG